jgi:hypothetical protein
MKPNARSTKPSHVNSAETEAMERYSPLVLDLVTIGFFFALQERQLGPKRVQNP